MFERFTDRARRAVVLAQEEARMLGHGYIGTEHILLGLLRESDGVAAQALEALGIHLDAVRREVIAIIGTAGGQQAGHIPFTPRTKKVLELSLREAQRLGDSYIGTEHILLGVAREGEGVGAQVLDRLGADLNRVRQQVIQVLSGYQAGGSRARNSGGGAPAAPRLRRPGAGSARDHPGGLAACATSLTRLNEIGDRLTAIENLLAEMHKPAARERKPAPGGARKPPAGQRKPAGAQRKPRPSAGAEPPASGRSRPQRSRPQQG